MQESAKSTVHSSILTLMGGVVPLVIALVTIPFLIQQIGAARFGALAIVWLLLGYFGQADFGIGRAVTQRIAGLPPSDRAGRARAAATALLLIIGVGAISALLAFLATHLFFSNVFEVTDALRAELLDSIWLISAAIPVVACFGVAHGCLIGSERFGLAAIATMASNALTQLLPLLVAIWIGAEMPALIAASLAGRAIGLVIALGGNWASLLKQQTLSASKQEATRLFQFGKWVMLSTLIVPFLVLSDRFMIGIGLGAAAVAAYAIPYQIASRTLVLPQAILTVMFPRLAALDAGQAKASAERIAGIVGNLYAVPIIILICLAESLLSLWLGSDLDPRSILVARILLAGFWINAVAQVPFNLLQAQGNPRFVAQLHALELPIYAALLFVLGAAFGLAGIAIAFALRCLIDLVVLSAKSGMNFSYQWQEMWIPFGLVMGGTALHPVLSGWYASTVAVAILGGIAAWKAMTIMPPEMRKVAYWKAGISGR